MAKIGYVVGFLFGDDFSLDGGCTQQVALIEKTHPEWQRGLLNGVGGRIQNGESPLCAMRREFREEAGLKIEDWRLAIVLTGQDWVVHFFSARGPVSLIRTQTDEKIHLVPGYHLPSDKIIPDLCWLIPLCLTEDLRRPIYIYSTVRDKSVRGYSTQLQREGG